MLRRCPARGEVGSDVFNAKASLGDSYNEMEGVIVSQLDWLPVCIKKDCCRQPSEPFVAVDQCMIRHYRVEKGSRFECERWVRVLTECARHGSDSC